MLVGPATRAEHDPCDDLVVRHVVANPGVDPVVLQLGVSAADLAQQIDVPVNRITAVINGQRGVTADTAIRLGHWFGTSPQFWLNLQTLYELRRAQSEIGEEVAKLPRLADRRRSPESTPSLL